MLALLDLLGLPHWTLLIPLVLLLTLRWWLAPFLIKQIVKSPTEVICDYCEPGKLDLAKEVRSYFANNAAGLSALGFRATPPFRQRMALANSEFWVQLHVRADTGDVASVVGTVTRGSSTTTVLKRLEFRTVFTDRTEQRTNNLNVREPYGSPAGVTSTRLPKLQDAAQLYRVHRKLVAARKGVQPKPEPLDDPIAYTREFERRDREDKLKRGFALEDRSARVIRPTWRGALALHFSTAPGFRAYHEWRNDRQQAALLKQARAA